MALARRLFEGKNGVPAAERRLRVQYAVVSVLAEAQSLLDATPRVLQAICETLDWQLGVLWRVDRDAKVLRCLGVWDSGETAAREFEVCSQDMTFEQDVGLPGRVWSSARPCWVSDVTKDPNFPRAPVARKVGLHGAFAFPIVARGGVLGVMEFFSPEIREPDEDVLRMVAAIGSQVGQFIERKEVEEAVAQSEALKSAIVESALDSIITMDHNGLITEFNPAAEQTFGYPRDEVIGKEMASFIIPPELRDAHRRGLARYLSTGDGPVVGRRIEVEAVRADGSRFPVELAITRVNVEGPPVFTGYIRDITGRREAESDRVDLLAREHEARAQAEAAQQKLAFLAEASTRLSSSLDLTATLDQLVKLAVPYLADWCFIDSRTEDGHTQRLALAFADPAQAGLAEELRHREPDRTSQHGVYEVLRTGEAVLVEDVGELLARIDVRTEDASLLDRVHPISYMIVPLVTGGRILGAITFVSSDPDHRYTTADLALAEDLARRAAVAIENARLYQERSHVARTLQQSLLPPQLPRIPHVEIAARYEPAEGLDVGGDFYDAFACGRRRWGVAIGDVCGKGAYAAALTGLARHTIRAAAMHRREPARVLEVLNEAILNQGVGERFASVAFGFLEVAGDILEFRIACGGHPAPMLLRADGEVVSVGRPGTLLGLFGEVDLQEDRVMLNPGDALVFYTDGVTESRRDGRVLGQVGLRNIVADCLGLNASHCAERIQTAAAEYRQNRSRDDTALMVLRVLAPRAPLPKRPTIDVKLAGGFLAPSNARAALTPLAQEIDLDQLEDLRFLVNELVTNAVKHARVPATAFVHLKVFLSPDVVRVEVTDPGSDAEPQMRSPGVEEGSGWGLYLVNRIADRWGVDTDGQTCVWFELDR